MQVFKLYYKILLRAMIVPIAMYVIIFGLLSFISTNKDNNPLESAFNSEKCKVAIIDNDASTLSKELSKYIQDNSQIIELNENDKKNLKDILFFRKVDYIITIPAGFEDAFITSDKLAIETMRIPDSASGHLVDRFVNKYLNTIEVYLKSGRYDIAEATDKTIADLSTEAIVKMTQEQKSENASGFIYYFNYLAYPLLAILVLCVSSVAIVMNDLDIMRRNNCSPYSASRFGLQTLLGHLTVAVFVYIIFYAMAAVLYRDNIFTKMGWLVSLNTFIFLFMSLCLSYMISFIAKKNTMAAISNTISLGSCFLGGVFVPQHLLSQTVKNIAVINPTFWYVKANNTLAELTVFNFETLKPVLFSMLVEFCFAIVFLSITLLLIRQKRTAEQ